MGTLPWSFSFPLLNRSSFHVLRSYLARCALQNHYGFPLRRPCMQFQKTSPGRAVQLEGACRKGGPRVMSFPLSYLWQDSCCERRYPNQHFPSEALTTTSRGRKRLTWKSFLIRLIWASVLTALTRGCTLITSVFGAVGSFTNTTIRGKT